MFSYFRSKRALLQTLEAQHDLLKTQDFLVTALKKALADYEEQVQILNRSGIQNLAVLLSAAGGEVLVSKDLIESIFSFEGNIDIDIQPDGDAVMMKLCMTEPEDCDCDCEDELE